MGRPDQDAKRSICSELSKTPLPSDKPEASEVTTGGFLSSSFDLLRGTDVHELPGDTVPAELLDEFFPQLSSDKKED